MIKVPVENLSYDPVILTGEVPTSYFAADEVAGYTVDKPLEYELKATRVGEGVLVRGSISTHIVGQCGRCLADVELDVVSDDICVHIEEPTQSEIDITENVYEDVMMLFPQNVLCSKECKGLCYECGTNLNTEPCQCTAPVDPKNIWGKLDDLTFEK